MKSAYLLTVVCAASLCEVAAALAAPAGAPATLQFHAPDEIAPAVLPYLNCLFAARGMEP